MIQLDRDDPAGLPPVDHWQDLALAATHRHRRQVIEDVVQIIEELTQHISAQWSPPTDRVDDLRDKYRRERESFDAAKKVLRRSLLPRDIDIDDMEASRYGGSSAALAATSWAREARRLADLAGATRVPLFRTAREADRRRFWHPANELMASGGRALQSLTESRDDAIRKAFAVRARQWRQQAQAEVTADGLQYAVRAFELRGPAPDDLLLEGLVASPQVRKLSRPLVTPGVVAFQGWTVQATVRADDTARTVDAGHLEWAAPPDAGLEFPFVVDLDAQGGFVTSSADAVQQAVLQLLATVPAGMLRIDGLDPVGLGESLNFLYGLNDAGDKILGDVVWTTADQAARLLTDLERHVTFVTQKYLQGQHKTLTDYNLAAGEVAEPYRVVLLYDFPHMFSRDGRVWDEESLVRLRKLATVGRRSGVFIFAVTAEPDQAMKVLTDLVPLTEFQIDGAPTSVEDTEHLNDVQLYWEFRPHPLPQAALLDEIYSGVLRGLEEDSTTQVDPGTVVDIAQQRESVATLRGLGSGTTVAHPDRPDTWWSSSSQQQITSRFGRLGASDVATLTLNSSMESSALIGGRTGSGKSFLLHAIILSLVTQYSPDELELYLVDLKEGVEFKQYADSMLPHARAVAIESNREFAVSVLASLDDEIARRGKAFKAAGGGGTVNLDRHRERTGEQWSRVVMVIDEFHKLFEKDDALKRQAEGLLERVIKEGRAFGVHVLLASQSIASVGGSFRSLAGQIYYRLVLASGEADSRLLLSEENTDAQLLTKPGEGIINAKAGLQEANNRFQAAFWSPDYRLGILTQLRAKADSQGITNRPAVFEGGAEFSVADLSRDSFGRSEPRGRLIIPIGAPMSLDPPIDVQLDRAPGGNLLIVHDAGAETVIMTAADLRVADMPVTLINFGALGSEWENALLQLRHAGATLHHARNLPGVLSDLIEEIRRRRATQDYGAPGRALILAGIQRARDLDPSDFDEHSPINLLRDILRDGPEVGLFTVIWADRPATLERRLSREAVRELGIKVLGTMNADSSRQLIDSEIASDIRPSQFVVDDFDRATTATVRKLNYAGDNWLADLLAGR